MTPSGPATCQKKLAVAAEGKEGDLCSTAPVEQQVRNGVDGGASSALAVPESGCRVDV